MTVKSKYPTDNSFYSQSQHSELSTLALDDADNLIEYGDENDSLSKSKSSLQLPNWISRFSLRGSQMEEQPQGEEESENEKESASNESISDDIKIGNRLNENELRHAQDEDKDDDDFENVILKGRNRRKKSDTATEHDSTIEARRLAFDSEKGDVKILQNSFLALEEYLDRKEALGEALTCKDTQEEEESRHLEKKVVDANTATAVPLKLHPKQKEPAEEIDPNLRDQIEVAKACQVRRQLQSNADEGSVQQPKRISDCVNSGTLECKMPASAMHYHRADKEKSKVQDHFEQSDSSNGNKIQVHLDPHEEEKHSLIKEEREALYTNTTHRQVPATNKHQSSLYHHDKNDPKKRISEVIHSPKLKTNRQVSSRDTDYTSLSLVKARPPTVSTNFDHVRRESIMNSGCLVTDTLSREKKNKDMKTYDFDIMNSNSKPYNRQLYKHDTIRDPFERLKKAGSSKATKINKCTPCNKRSFFDMNGKEDGKDISQWNVMDNVRAKRHNSLPIGRRTSKPMQEYSLSDVTGLGRRKKRKSTTSSLTQWGIQGSIEPRPLPNRSSMTDTPRAGQLSAATKTSSLLLLSRHRPKSTSKGKEKRTLSPRISSELKEKAWPLWDTTDTTPSFGPNFLNKKERIISRREPIINDDSDNDVCEGSETKGIPCRKSQYPGTTTRVFNSLDGCNHSYSSSHCVDVSSRDSNRKKSKLNGSLMNILSHVRGNTEADWVRFQSGSFPFCEETKRKIDINDPRNRADSFMDITIVKVGTHVPTRPNQVMVYGFVHCWYKNDRNIHKRPNKASRIRQTRSPESIRKISQMTKTIMMQQVFDKPKYAWFSFNQETIRENGITKGAQIRMYNAIALLIPTIGDGCPLVLCTRLCESYPRELPSLPDVLGLVDTPK